MMYYIGVKQSFLFLYYMYYVTAEIITPQIINAYDSGENSKSAVRYLASAGHNVPVTLDAHTRVRNYLIVQMGVNNATRTGALMNMTVANVRNAEQIGATYVIQVILKWL